MYKKLLGATAILAVDFMSVNVFLPYLSKQNSWIAFGLEVVLGITLCAATFEFARWIFHSGVRNVTKQEK